MRITMEHAQRLTLVEMREFVASSGSLSFTGAGRKEIYGLVECTLQAHEYLRLAKKNKGVVRRYLTKISGRSLAQITRLIRRYRQSGAVQPAAPRRHRFPRRYTQDDIALLATVDAAHEGLSGPALRRILWREYHVYGKAAYRRLASLSASHIYNLRRTAAYRQHHVHHTRTRSRAVAIGERRRPNPCGRPGYLRVDTVHQGDTAHAPRAVPHQCRRYGDAMAGGGLLPDDLGSAFAARAGGHPAPVPLPHPRLSLRQRLGVSQPSGGQAAELLIAEFTKSRAHRTTDNARKNGAVVRKHIGHEPIAAEHAAEFQRFYTAWFNPYLNFHRPCGFATVEVSEQGKRRRHYRLEDYRTPYEKLVSLDEWEQHLKPGITADFLEQQTQRMSDTECARNMQQRKRKLLAQCRSRW